MSQPHPGPHHGVRGHRRVAPKAARANLPSLAVLPFQDARPGREDALLGEGLAGELLRNLDAVEGLRVLPRTSSFHLVRSGLGAAALGRALGVDHLVSGRLTPREGQTGLAVDLLRLPEGTVAWSRRWTLNRAEVQDLLGSLVSDLCGALGVAVPKLRRHSARFEAFEAYLRGRQAYHRFSRLGMLAAREAFEEALALDPGYALAWSGLALCHAYLYIYVERSEAHRARAAEASQRALDLDPELAEAHVSRGVALAAAGEGTASDEAFEAALVRDPNLFEAYYFYARHAFASGRPEEAIQFFEWAAVLRPEDYQAPLLVAQAYVSLGIPDEAEAARRKGLTRVEARLKHEPGDARAWYMGANALVALGEREQGLAWARKARELDPGDSMLLYNLGCIHALAGEHAAALDCLEQAVAAGLTEKAWILNDGDLQDLHGESRFQALVARL